VISSRSIKNPAHGGTSSTSAASETRRSRAKLPLVDPPPTPEETAIRDAGRLAVGPLALVTPKPSGKEAGAMVRRLIDARRFRRSSKEAGLSRVPNSNW